MSNAIQRARQSAGLTQEALAERAGYSVDTIRAWETGGRKCPMDALDILCEILGAPWLAGTYLREIYRSAAEVIPDFRAGVPLAEATAAFISAVLEMTDGRFDRQLLRMVADGRVTADEAPAYREIMDLAERSVVALYELRYAIHRGGDDNGKG